MSTVFHPPRHPDRPVADLLAALALVEVDAAEAERCSAWLHEVRRVRGWLDAFEARVSSRLAELSRTSGAAPVADTHARCGGVSAAEARRRERRSATLDEVPGFAAALADGRIGAEHVDALAATTSRLEGGTTATLLEQADRLLAAAETMSPEQFSRHVRRRATDVERDHGLARNARQRHDTFLSRRTDLATGMVEGRFALHPELAEQIFSAVDREVATMLTEHVAATDSVDRNRLAAEALGGLVAGGHRHRHPLEADITVIVDAATLATGELHDHSICETRGGLDLSPASVARLLCGGVVTPIIVDTRGNVLNAGRSIRHANRHQRRALRAMYRTCAFAGCDVPFQRCEIHHLLEWDRSGATDLDNLLPLCSRHHHLVHDHRWGLRLLADRTLVITRPDGHEHARTRPELADTARPRRRRRHGRPPDPPPPERGRPRAAPQVARSV